MELQNIRIISDVNKVSKETFDRHLNLLENKIITEQMRINYNLYNGITEY